MQIVTRVKPISHFSADRTRLHFAKGSFSTIEPDALNDAEPTMLFGMPLTNASLKSAAFAIVNRAAAQRPSIIHFVNAHCVNMMFRSRRYSRALSAADALLPDGSGMWLAAKLAGKAAPANLNGTDLFPLLCKEAALHDQSLYLLGGGEGIVEKTAERMQREIAGLKIAGRSNGYWLDADEEVLISQINSSGATILLVGLGVPKQEVWIARNRNKLTVPVIMGVGGLFDYYSGRIPRAPVWMRAIGCEWVWRLAQEPRRLAARYLIGNIVFMGHAIAYAWVARGKAEHYANASKRTLDMAIALCALVLLGPLTAAICLLITLEDRGPVFFTQTRIGENGKPFKMWKFRSMAVDAEARRLALLDQNERDSVCFKMRHDPRITLVGRFIRRASMDELPQLINVLKGDMSIVGPRPALPQEVMAYRDRDRGRLLGKPGITCIWQVSGRAEVPFETQVSMDIRYLRRKSLLQDISLIARTIPAVLRGRGAY